MFAQTEDRSYSGHGKKITVHYNKKISQKGKNLQLANFITIKKGT